MTGRRGGHRSWLSLALVVAVLASGCQRVVTLELPELDRVAREPPAQSFVYDADGDRLATLRREFREPVELDELPRHLIDAVVAAEDQRFFTHGGVDARAVARAAIANVAEGEVAQGGSTITQQLVKNLYMPEAARTPETKLSEAVLARRVEATHTKREILERYLNTVYFGNGAYGIQAAARTYFRQSAARLDLAEAALLAGTIRAPGSLDPATHSDAARARRDEILERMHAAGDIGDVQLRAATTTEVTVEPRLPTPTTREPHWVRLVERTLLDDPDFGGTEADRAQRLYGGGLRIHTTLDPDLQETARTVLRDALGGDDDPDGAIVSVDPATGHILAAAGNRAYDQLEFDLATQARRQPGSTFKTFVVAAAIAAGRTPETELDGSQTPIELPDGRWRLRNFDGRSYGRVDLAGATRASVNTAFARLALDVGVSRVAATARAMGVRSRIPDDPMIAVGAGSLGLTPLELAASYATLANLGRHIEATPIARIETADGEVVWRADDTETPALSPSAAFVTTGMLRDTVESGTALGARVDGWQVAGKTGTTDDNADAWFAGYTATLSTSLWLGHHEGRVPMRNVLGVAEVTGGSIPAQLWSEYMARALAGDDPVDFRLPPEEYEIVEIDPDTGLRAADWCPGEPTPMPQVLVPDETCPSPSPTPDPPPLPPPSTATGDVSPATPSPTPGAPPSPAPSAPSEEPDDDLPAPSPTGTDDGTGATTPPDEDGDGGGGGDGA